MSNAELIAEAEELIERFDRSGSWTPDSPIGTVAQLVAALKRAEARPLEYGVTMADPERPVTYFRELGKAQEALIACEETVTAYNASVSSHEELFAPPRILVRKSGIEPGEWGTLNAAL